jgi:hypothetical protein
MGRPRQVPCPKSIGTTPISGIEWMSCVDRTPVAFYVEIHSINYAVDSQMYYNLPVLWKPNIPMKQCNGPTAPGTMSKEHWNYSIIEWMSCVDRTPVAFYVEIHSINYAVDSQMYYPPRSTGVLSTQDIHSIPLIATYYPHSRQSAHKSIVNLPSQMYYPPR